MTKNKKIIAVSAASNKGKTTSVKKIVALLQNEYENGKLSNLLNPRLTVDVLYIFIIGKIKIGIASQGDKNDLIERNLKPLLDAECEIIICAVHTEKSGTYKYVEGLTTHGYEFVVIRKTGGSSEAERNNSDDDITKKILEEVAAVVLASNAE